MEEERAMCLARSALARAQCKKPYDFSYVGKQRDNIFIFNGFYGAKYTDFYCKVDPGEILVLSKKKLFRRSVKYYIDENECGIIQYFPASCTERSVIRCCFPKSRKEKKADREAEFWQRSIPDLLKEDQVRAISEQQNRTSKSSETKPEEQSPE
ncbi:conserved protein of unknown function [Maridesulfovibrio hydrothermalis AM13 = DSM 14728]|uniref:Uncharacterized protein n=2 Tax=Maridesulfovibrio TaxID=2794998 RepID=L0RGU9_9BACT|nr:conserved protein of unknown function [Maridesulfovibrio hydrothermalis AM13 = DSM 14728]